MPGNFTNETPDTLDLVHKVFDDGIDNITTNIARSLTQLAWPRPLANSYWSSADIVLSAPDVVERLAVVYGRAASSVTYVKARFEWMILPVLLEVAAVVLLGMTVRLTKKKGRMMWKSSVLALLAHGIKDEKGGFVVEKGGRLSVPEMERRAEEMRVELKMTGRGYGFSSEEDVEQRRGSTLDSGGGDAPR